MNEDTVMELAEGLGRLLLERGMLSATAESCTGGGIAAAITEIAGSSAWFDRGFVTYSNEAKMEMLGVSPETLRDFGAVSEETAREMALGALARSRAGAAVSVTGIAGPAGAVPGKPVGTVCFGFAVRGAGGGEPQVVTETRHFSGGRRDVRLATQAAALRGLAEAVSGLRVLPQGKIS